MQLWRIYSYKIIPTLETALIFFYASFYCIVGLLEDRGHLMALMDGFLKDVKTKKAHAS